MITQLNRRIVLPFLARRAGKPLFTNLHQLEKTQWDSPETIRARQLLELRRMFRHAFDTVAYYRKSWMELGLQPDDLKSFDDLKNFPILTKKLVRENFAELRSIEYDEYDDSKVYWKTTSGSTGVPLKIAVDWPAVWWKQACTLRADINSGYQLGGRVAKVWGNPEYRHFGWKGRLRNYFVDRAMYLDTIKLDEARLSEFTSLLKRKQPSLLFGHAHSLYLFACYVLKHAPNSIKPDGIISTAMVLHDWQREIIEKAFATPVCNRYGCEETSIISCEISGQKGLYQASENLYCEVVPDPSLSLEANQGRLLLTDLKNRAMPLIRYQVGDVAETLNEPSLCGRGLPRFAKVLGREADYVLTPEGKLISGISLTENFAMHITGTAQLQIVQDRLNLLRLRLVPSEQFGPTSHDQIAQLIQELFGPKMKYEVELMETIPQETNGKYRFCISPIAVEYLRNLA